MTDHLLACTIMALAASGIVLVMRGRRYAGWRHALLLAAVLRFAVPTSWLVGAGSTAARSLPGRVASIPAVDNLRALLHGPHSIGAATASASHKHSVTKPEDRYRHLPLWWFAWGTGFIICSTAWLKRRARSTPSVRLPNDLESAALGRATSVFTPRNTVTLRIAASGTTPGVGGLLRHRIILPEDLSAQLIGSELDAVLAHELAHAARFDNLAALLVHATLSVFWFHPLLWWMERRMFAERETACDEIVIARGASPEDYISAILKVCRMAVNGLYGYAGVTGSGAKSSLAARKEHIMSIALARPSSHWLRAAGGVILGIAALIPAAAGFLRAQPTGFAVATIKQNKRGCCDQGGVGHGGGGGEHATLSRLISTAYKFGELQIIGGPGWIRSDRFDVWGKAEDPNASFDQLRLMLQSLLEDRFRLKVHRAIRRSSVFELVAAKGGSKLEPSKDQASPDDNRPAAPGAGPNRGVMRFGRGMLVGNSVTLPLIVSALPNLGRPIIDKTGLTGRFDFQLIRAPGEEELPSMPNPESAPTSMFGMNGRTVTADPSGPDIFTAVQEQLGLKLQSSEAPIEVLVIDHVERPSEN